MAVAGNVPCSAAVDMKDLALQVRGQNSLMFPKEEGLQKIHMPVLVLVSGESYPTVSQNGDFIPAVYLNQGEKPMSVI